MMDLAESLLIGLCVFTIVLSLVLWVKAGGRITRGIPLIPWSPRRPVPWTIFDLVATAFIGMCLIQVATLIVAKMLGIPSRDLLDPEIGARHEIPRLVGFSCASLATWLLALLLLRLRSGATLNDLGFKPFKLAEVLRLSGAAFIMLVVPTLIIQFLAVKAFQTDERHPFIDMIKENPDFRALIPIALAAVVVAPVVEEFLFRVLLQSWLERVCQNLGSYISHFRVKDDPPPSIGELDDDGTGLSDSQPLELATRQAEPAAVVAPATERQGESTKTQWAPIIISGLLFGSVHLGQGPAPIALSFLGVGLGYLFQRTHRVWPCMIVHALVNLLAVAQLGIYISNPSAL